MSTSVREQASEGVECVATHVSTGELEQRLQRFLILQAAGAPFQKLAQACLPRGLSTQRIRTPEECDILGEQGTALIRPKLAVLAEQLGLSRDHPALPSITRLFLAEYARGVVLNDAREARGLLSSAGRGIPAAITRLSAQITAVTRAICALDGSDERRAEVERSLLSCRARGMPPSIALTFRMVVEFINLPEFLTDAIARRNGEQPWHRKQGVPSAVQATHLASIQDLTKRHFGTLLHPLARYTARVLDDRDDVIMVRPATRSHHEPDVALTWGQAARASEWGLQITYDDPARQRQMSEGDIRCAIRSFVRDVDALHLVELRLGERVRHGSFITREGHGLDFEHLLRDVLCESCRDDEDILALPSTLNEDHFAKVDLVYQPRAAWPMGIQLSLNTNPIAHALKQSQVLRAEEEYHDQYLGIMLLTPVEIAAALGSHPALRSVLPTPDATSVSAYFHEVIRQFRTPLPSRSPDVRGPLALLPPSLRAALREHVEHEYQSRRRARGFEPLTDASARAEALTKLAAAFKRNL